LQLPTLSSAWLSLLVVSFNFSPECGSSHAVTSSVPLVSDLYINLLALPRRKVSSSCEISVYMSSDPCCTSLLFVWRFLDVLRNNPDSRKRNYRLLRQCAAHRTQQCTWNLFDRVGHIHIFHAVSVQQFNLALYLFMCALPGLALCERMLLSSFFLDL
jgi:hypothetical protein